MDTQLPHSIVPEPYTCPVCGAIFTPKSRTSPGVVRLCSKSCQIEYAKRKSRERGWSSYGRKKGSSGRSAPEIG
jgi:hypothetical protein